MKNESWIVAAAVLFWVAPAIQAQESSTARDGGLRLYESLVDQLFRPKEYGDGTVILLRYLPTDLGEMQVQIHETDRGQIELDIWELPSGSPNIWIQFLDLTEEHPSWGVEDLARAIEVDHAARLVDRSSELSMLIMDNRPGHVSLMGSDTLAIDGTAYRLTLTSLSRDLSVELRGPQDASTSKDPLIRWMGEVRTAIESHLVRKVGAATSPP